MNQRGQPWTWQHHNCIVSAADALTVCVCVSLLLIVCLAVSYTMYDLSHIRGIDKVVVNSRTQGDLWRVQRIRGQKLKLWREARDKLREHWTARVRQLRGKDKGRKNKRKAL